MIALNASRGSVDPEAIVRDELPIMEGFNSMDAEMTKDNLQTHEFALKDPYNLPTKANKVAPDGEKPEEKIYEIDGETFTEKNLLDVIIFNERFQ